MLNIKPSDRARIVGVIDPDLNTAGAVSTGWVAVADFANFMAIVLAGALGTSATLDAKIEEAQDDSGTGVQDLSGHAITQLTDAGSDSDKQAVIDIAAADVTEGFTHIRLTMTVATASSDSAGLILGFDAKYEPATDLASVDEIV